MDQSFYKVKQSLKRQETGRQLATGVWEGGGALTQERYTCSNNTDDNTSIQ